VTSRRPWKLGLVLLTLAVGCNSDSGPTTYPVTGALTQGGKPLAGALVEFTPAGRTEQGGIAEGMAGAQAQTDAEGRYMMSIMLDMGKTTKQGLPAGDYVVTVRKLEFPGGAASATQPPKNVLPAEYAATDSTPLKATVKADGDNRFDFPL
jgi:hypothetical protein